MRTRKRKSTHTCVDYQNRPDKTLTFSLIYITGCGFCLGLHMSAVFPDNVHFRSRIHAILLGKSYSVCFLCE